jgi:hypothetical protein
MNNETQQITFDAKLTQVLIWLLDHQKHPKSMSEISKLMGKNPQYLSYRLKNLTGFGILALRDLLKILNDGKAPNSNNCKKLELRSMFNIIRPQGGRYAEALPDSIVFHEIKKSCNLRKVCKTARINYKQMNYFLTTQRVDIRSEKIAALLAQCHYAAMDPHNEMFDDWLFSSCSQLITKK